MLHYRISDGTWCHRPRNKGNENMNDESDEDKVLRYGDITISPADVPAMSLFALAQRGFTHVLGNEVASALTAWRKSEEGAKADQGAIDAWVKARREVKLE